MRDTFIKRLRENAENDSKIIFITGDLGFGVVETFKKILPKQFINAGVAEQNMTMLAAGLSLDGFIPFTYSIGNFPTLRCLEMIRNDAAYHDSNVKVVSIGGGFSYGQLGMSHHATEDIAIMRVIPNLTVVVPCNRWEVIHATDAICKLNGTCYLRLDKDSGQETNSINGDFSIGRVRVINEGVDCAIFVCGGILSEVEIAFAILREKGINPFVVSVHTIKPLDVASICASANKCKVVVTVEEHSIIGGLGGAVAETLVTSGISPKKFIRIGLDSCFSSIVGDQKFLRKVYGMDSVAICSKIMKALDEN